MKLALETDGLEVDDWIRDFTKATVAFAVWDYEGRVEGVTIRLGLTAEDRLEAAVRCRLHVDTKAGPIHSEGTGRDVDEAIMSAANRVELALYGSGVGAADRRSTPIAA